MSSGRRTVVEHLAPQPRKPPFQSARSRPVVRCLHLESANLRLAAVPEVVVDDRGFRVFRVRFGDAVPLDHVPDAIAVRVGVDPGSAGAPSRGDVDLRARLGSQVRVAGHEAAARDPPVVAVGQKRIAETVRGLEGQLEPRAGGHRDRGESRGLESRRAPVSEIAAAVRARHAVGAEAAREPHATAGAARLAKAPKSRRSADSIETSSAVESASPSGVKFVVRFVASRP